MTGLMPASYSILTAALAFIAMPFLRLWSAVAGGETAASLRERLGDLPGGLPRGAIVVHAASVGEVTALAPFFRALTAPGGGRRPVVLSLMTPAGRRRARDLYPFPVIQAPLDAPAPVRRWLDRAVPAVLVIVETELWPVWLRAAAARGPVVWVNGRISDRSWPLYRLIRPLMAGVLSRLSLLAVISERDRRRAIALGARPNRVRVTGNLKVDALIPAAPPLGIPTGAWLVAGSTRPGEEEAVLAAFTRVRARVPRARLCLAPRHLARAPAVERLVRAAGFTVHRRSTGGAGRADCLLLDTHGELAAMYRRARVAFVGGTLAPVGGHNVLEPALAGAPVVFGPYTANVREHAAGLVRAGGGFRVRDPRDLGARLTALMAAPRTARAAGGRARRWVRAQQGVAPRVVALLRRGGWA